MIELFGIKIFSFKEGKIFLEDEYTPKDVSKMTKKILKERKELTSGMEYLKTLDVCGIKYEINYRGIKNHERFFRRFFKNKNIFGEI